VSDSTHLSIWEPVPAEMANKMHWFVYLYRTHLSCFCLGSSETALEVSENFKLHQITATE